jgi:hypothetical protein
MADVDVTDILLAIARQVTESLEGVQIKIKPGYFVNLFREVGEILQTPVEISGADFSVGIAKPVQLRQGGECKEGIALLQQMILARAFPDVNVVQRIDLISEVFDSPETLARLCCVSGGHARNLLMLLSRCLERDDPPLSRDCIEGVIRQRRNELSLAITEDEWEWLREVAQQKSLRGEEKYQTLVRDMFVFEYRDSEGSWFDINPILAEAKEFQL